MKKPATKSKGGTGNAAIDAAIEQMADVIMTEGRLGRSPLRSIVIIAPMRDGHTFVATTGCQCPACKIDVAAAAEDEKASAIAAAMTSKPLAVH